MTRISIHLMLKFIWVRIHSIGDKVISIHLMLKFIRTLLLLYPNFSHFNTSHVEVYPSVSHTSDFFITLFFLYFQSFTDFYQPMTLYYFRYLVLHKSFVFTTLFHISCFHHLVKFPYSFFISISSNFHLYHVLHFLESLLQIHSRSSVL